MKGILMINFLWVKKKMKGKLKTNLKNRENRNFFLQTKNKINPLNTAKISVLLS